MKGLPLVIALALGLGAGCATTPTGPATPPLPFARVQDIPTVGATVMPDQCPGGETGLIIVPADQAYTIFLHDTRAIIVDNEEGEDTPVWFVRVTEDRAFVLAFVLSYRDAKARYPHPCDWLAPTPEAQSARLRLVRATARPAGTSRPYHAVAVAAFAQTRWTHVCTTGTVTLVKREADGDWHIRVSDGPAFIVAEIIPTLTATPPLQPPKPGQHVKVCGIRRYDDDAGHGWWEEHPLESWEALP